MELSVSVPIHPLDQLHLTDMIGVMHDYAVEQIQIAVRPSSRRLLIETLRIAAANCRNQSLVLRVQQRAILPP